MVASALLNQGVSVLEKIERELVEIMTRKGYTCIEDFQGKLKDGATNGSSCSTKRVVTAKSSKLLWLCTSIICLYTLLFKPPKCSLLLLPTSSVIVVPRLASTIVVIARLVPTQQLSRGTAISLVVLVAFS